MTIIEAVEHIPETIPKHRLTLAKEINDYKNKFNTDCKECNVYSTIVFKNLFKKEEKRDC